MPCNSCWNIFILPAAKKIKFFYFFSSLQMRKPYNSKLKPIWRGENCKPSKIGSQLLLYKKNKTFYYTVNTCTHLMGALCMSLSRNRVIWGQLQSIYTLGTCFVFFLIAPHIGHFFFYFYFKKCRQMALPPPSSVVHIYFSEKTIVIITKKDSSFSISILCVVFVTK